MKRYAALVVAGVVALLGFTSMGASAQAQRAAYPVPTLQIILSTQTVLSGHTFVGTAKADIKCDLLTETWNGQSAHAAGSQVSHTFQAPIVKHVTVIPIKAVCRYTVVTGTAGLALSATAKTLTRSANVKVLPVPKTKGAGTSSGPTLPNTGGPDLLWFILGGGAVALGGFAMVMGRRRNDDKVAH